MNIPSVDLLITCPRCGSHFVVTLEVAQHGPTPLGDMVCLECRESEAEAQRELDEAEEWHPHVREPFTSEDDAEDIPF